MVFRASRSGPSRLLTTNVADAEWRAGSGHVQMTLPLDHIPTAGVSQSSPLVVLSLLQAAS
jgi:hypothetical protein